MREINIKEKSGVSSRYVDVPQPMKIYHSTEELKVYEKGALLVKDLNDFNKLVLAYKMTEVGKYYDLTKLRVFIATDETIVPEKQLKDGAIICKLKDGKAIKTDNCYIGLYILYSFGNKYICFTSSGIFAVSLRNWSFTAAIKHNYSNANFAPTKTTYQTRLNHILEKKRTTVADMRFMNLFLNPISDFFLDLDVSLKQAYPGINSKDRLKIIKTQRLRKLFVKELGNLMPELKDEIKRGIPPTQIRDWLMKVANDTVGSSEATVDEKLKSVQAVLNIGYDEEINIPLAGDPAAGLPGFKQQPIQIGAPQASAEGESISLPTGEVDLNEQAKKEIEEGKEEPISFDKLREETGSMDGFVIEDDI